MHSSLLFICMAMINPRLLILYFVACWLGGRILLAEDVEGTVVAQELESYTVIAFDFKKETLEIPADVTRIARDTIDRSLATSVPDLLQTEANLYFSKISGSTNVSMRGFGEGSGLRSLILVDGQQLNPSDMGRINWEQIPLDSVESIEVLRGGHNVLYGDRALAGVIKIETRRAAGERLNVEGRVGSFESRQASVSGGVGAENWGVSAGAFHEESDGYRDHSDSESRNYYLTAGRTFQNGDDLDLRVGWGDTDLQYSAGLKHETYKSDPTSSNYEGGEGSHNEYNSSSARYEALREWGSWEVFTGYGEDATNWSFGGDSFGKNQQSSYNLKPSARVELDPVTLVFGTDLIYETLDFTKYLDEAHTIVPGEAKLSESRIAPYLLVEYELTDQWTLSAGARYEWIRYKVDYDAYERSQLNPFNETNRGQRPNPFYKNPPDQDPEASFDGIVHEQGMAAEISLNFRVSEDLSVWFGYDRVYRYPVFDERAGYQGYSLAENVNQELEAERGNSYELGFKFLNGAHEFSATAFLLLMENEIIFDGDVEGSNQLGTGLNINLGAVNRYGGDLAYILTQKNWGFSTRLAYVHTEMRAGEGKGYEVPLVPAIHTVSQLWWKPLERLRFNLVHRYVGEQYEGGDFDNSEAKIDAYSVYNIQAELECTTHAQVYMSVGNVFDKLYAESASYGSYYPGDGRSLSVGFKLNF
jgi:iron complex outermembrane receptor protein